MKTFIKTLFLILLIAASPLANAQAEMADGMRSEGKIYVVVTIIVIILAGLITYLLLLDRKLSRMEQKLRDKQQTNR